MRLLLLTDRAGTPETVVPALAELRHEVLRLPLDHQSPLEPSAPDVVLLDATGDLGKAVTACRSEVVQSLDRPLLAILTFGALAALKVTWGFDDWLLPEVSAAELRTRLRLAQERLRKPPQDEAMAAVLRIDHEGYRAHLRGRPLELTYTEFELLRAFVARAGQVWSRSALLREVWGYDHHVVGTRTVDVHVTRLRAKLGAESGAHIQTVRNVGYKLVISTV